MGKILQTNLHWGFSIMSVVKAIHTEGCVSCFGYARNNLIVWLHQLFPIIAFSRHGIIQRYIAQLHRTKQKTKQKAITNKHKNMLKHSINLCNCQHQQNKCEHKNLLREAVTDSIVINQNQDLPLGSETKPV